MLSPNYPTMRHYKHLSPKERDKIFFLYHIENRDKSYIAQYLNRDNATIGREIKRNKTIANRRDNNNPKTKDKPQNYYYSPDKAQKKYMDRRKESKQLCPLKTVKLYKYVIKKLKEGLSPDLVSGRAKLEGIGRISHECVYQFIYSRDGRKMELYKYLPRSHKRRKKKIGRKQRRTLIPNRVGIEARPETAEDREEFGHWETDSVLGIRKGHALNTNRERKTRYMIITKINRKTTDNTKEAIIKRFKPLPPEAKISNTADNGSEFTKHEEITAAIGMKFYFANPYHSWERGTNENGNGLIRRFFPKKTNFNDIPEEEIEKVEEWINNRPMKCLDYKTPQEVFNEELEKITTLKYIKLCLIFILGLTAEIPEFALDG